MIYFQHFFLRICFIWRILFCYLTTSHKTDHIVHTHLSHFNCTKSFSITHDCNPITNSFKFFHTMGNIDNRSTLTGNFLYSIKKTIDFRICQRSSGFIHNDDFCSKCKCLGYFYHLLLCNTQIRYFSPDINVKVQSIYNLCSLFIQFFFIQQSMT